MDKILEIQLGEYKNINSVNVDLHEKLFLKNKSANILEYDIRNVLSVTEVFDAERQANEIYRIYGNIEWLSILNGLREDYNALSDFFLPFYSPPGESHSFKNLLNSFEIYLVRPSTVFTAVTTTDNEYIRYFEVIATLNEIELYNAGFSKNIFNEQKYGFNLNIDIDISDYIDGLGFPLTELFLYFQYIPKENDENIPEEMQRIVWNNNSGLPNVVSYAPTQLSIGDRIIGNKILLNKLNYSQELLQNQIYYISTPYSSAGNIERLIWYYNPFVPLRLRYFNNEIKRANTGSTSYEVRNSIPYYAISISDGNYVWREILPQGYIDPITSNGVDYPFINGKRYLFSNIVLDIVPSLDDFNTGNVFSEIKLNNPTVLNTRPITDLNDIGKPCQ